MDFFSILLPGALPTYLLMDNVGPLVLGDRYFQTRRCGSLGRLPVRELSFWPPVFLLGSWLVAISHFRLKHGCNVAHVRECE
jgi:hypothetical protein